MSKSKLLATASAGAIGYMLLVGPASATYFNIPGGDLKAVLDAYASQAGVPLIYSGAIVKGTYSKGATGDLSSDAALNRILAGTGFGIHREADAIAIVRGQSSNAAAPDEPLQLAQAAPAKAIETVTVTSSKLGGADVQSIPISITALSQQQLTATQIAGGPDLIKQVPNMTFTKTNFSGYSIELRGIGTQAISVTTDPAVAVAFNDIPFIRNHFFEQEFYDVSTGRSAARAAGHALRPQCDGRRGQSRIRPSRRISSRRCCPPTSAITRTAASRAMLNLPIVGRPARYPLRRRMDQARRLHRRHDPGHVRRRPRSVVGPHDHRLEAGIGHRRPISSGSISREDDDRLRSGKQLCETAPIPTASPVRRQTVARYLVRPSTTVYASAKAGYLNPANYLSQGCQATSLYSPSAFEVPNGYSLPYVTAAKLTGVDQREYRSLRGNDAVDESARHPIGNPADLRAKNDTLEYNADYNINSALTLTSQTGYNQRFSVVDRRLQPFRYVAGRFLSSESDAFASNNTRGDRSRPTAYFCDPQLGCSDRLVAEDLSDEQPGS